MKATQAPKNEEVEVVTVEDIELPVSVEQDLEASDASIQSFLADLSVMKVLPSSKKLLAPARRDEVSTNPKLNDPEYDRHSNAGPLSRVQDVEWNMYEAKERMEEASLYFDAQLEGEQRTTDRRRKDISTSDPRKREGSESPRTDPDFVESSTSSSSHSSIISWIAGEGMISRKIADSMMSGGDGHESTDEVLEKAANDNKLEERSGVEGNAASDEAAPKDENRNEENEDDRTRESESSDNESEDESDGKKVDIDVETNQITGDQVKLAAAVTMLMLALMWKFEPRN